MGCRLRGHATLDQNVFQQATPLTLSPVDQPLLDIERIRSSTRSAQMVRCLTYVHRTTSTNDDLKQELFAGGAGGVIRLAESQSAGRGRFRRVWESPCGASLLMSVGLVDESGALQDGKISLLAAVAICDAVRQHTELTPTIKWPNDLMVHGRKLGGVLVETTKTANGATAYVLGIGLNCLQQAVHFQGPLRGKATSLEMESRQPIDRTALAVLLIHALDRWLSRPGDWSTAELRQAWLARAEPMGKHVRLQHGGRVFTGTMLDIDPAAALLVQLDEGGIRAFNAADTTVALVDH